MSLTKPKNQMDDVERINKETGELSTSGEHAVAPDLNLNEGVEMGERGGQPHAHTLRILREMLQQLEIHTQDGSEGTSRQTQMHLSPNHTHSQENTVHQGQILAPLPPDQREGHLFRILPIYIQVCESAVGTEELDLKSLAALSAETVISNIHDRLAKKPAEEARYDVQQYFQERGRMDNTEDKSQADHKEADRSETGVRQTDKSETDDRQTDRSETDHWTTQADNKGWLLLKTLSLLFATDTRDSMLVVKPGLPAALVKCLYLLVCLPARKEETGGEESFEELLTQVLVQLCSYPSSVKEMMETPELQCLIISLTSLHDLTSSPWRNKASRVLRAVSAAKTTNTIPCLQAKNCVRICIQNLQRISDHAPGPVLAELTATVFSFISDSYQLNPALFTEFETNHGYNVLQDIMTRCEEGVPEEQFRPVEDLLSLIASLCLFGRSELKVALCVTNPQPPGFKFDPSISTGSAVKNLSAFRLLQRSFQRSDDLLLCSQILRTIRSVWSWNRANFFLLEWTVQSLAQVAQCVWRKPPAVHRLFFSMLEMVVFQLNYIPHEAVRAVQAVLKQALAGAVAGGSGFGVIALGSFHRLIVCSSLLAEVLSDGGLLELLLGELRRRAKILRKSGGAGPRSSEDDSERSLTTSMLRVVAALTLRSIRNTVSVRDLGMIPYIKIFLDDEQYRGLTLSILEQLSEVNPDEFMSTTIGALCSSTQHELGLKQDLLQSILKVLENPNSWGAFRRAGGFTGLLSLVVDMEGALGDPGGVWGSVGQKGVLDLLLLILHTLALAVHVDPVSSHHFQAEGYYEKLADALLQLGCFQTEGQETSEVAEGPAGGLVSDGWGLAEGCGLTDDPHSHGRSFHQFVELSENPGPTPSSSEAPLPPSLQACIRLLSYLDQFATGTCASLKTGAEQGGEREAQGKRGKGERPQAMSSATLTPEDELQGRSRPSAHSVSTVGSQSNYRVTCEQTILHPGAIRVIVTLLPHVFQAEDPQLSIEVQFSVAHHLQVMVNSERNRQIICGGGLVSTLLTHFRGTLLKTDHPLHLPVTRILEKLASHSISHKDFRSFLCLSNPLMCKARKMSSMSAPESQAQSQSPEEPEMTSEGKNNARPNVKTLKRSFSVLRSLPSVASDVGQPLPLHQIISLVSMTSPRSFRPHSVSTSPAFVEFDMTENGYGCLFLPSLATVKGVNADSIPTGGIGGDCRGFPSAAGLSFSCWFLISRFSLACDSHPIRLLSVVRHMSRAEQQYICLSISFSAGDGCLVISTDEEPFTFLDMMEPEMRPPSQLPGCLRFKCSSHLTPGQWHHLTVVMAKDMKKTCNVSAYLNGKSVGVAKMLYIQPFPGQYVSMEPTAVIDVCAFIGTPSLWKQHAALVWRVGPTYLFEETLSPEAVRVIYNQGTTYLGNYLAVHNTGSGLDTLTPLRLVPEERISFGINTAVATFTTVAQIRESYNEVDCRLIAKEMGIASRDSSTPVFLSLNISQHLTGTARTVGAALVGHFGMRTFAPSSAGDGFLYLGGPVVILSLIAMAADDGALYAAVKVLLSVLETSPAMLREMNRINGYKLLAFLLKTKNGLVTHRTFQLVLSLSGSVDHFGSGTTSLHNKLAFSTLLCDLEVWENTPDHLDLSVLNHFADILKSSSGDHGNAEVMHNLGLVLKLLFLLADPSVTTRKVKLIIFVITRLVMGHFTSTDIRRLGLFLVHTLPPPSVNETSALSDNCLNEDTQGHISSPASPVWIRNQLLSSLCDLVGSDSRLPADEQKELIQTLGSDWFLLFLQPHLHPSSLCLGLRLFTFVLANQSERDSFIEGVSPGILLESLDEPLGIMDNLRSHEWSWECLSVTCPGFDVLQRLLVREAHVPQVYGALAALLLGKGAVDTPDGQVLDEVLQAVINSITLSDWAHLQLCSKSAALLLELVKVLITQTSAAEDSWELQFPGSVMHFLCLLHSHCPRDPLWMSSEFLQALASIIFPPHCTEEEEGLTWVCQTNRKQVCDLIHVVLMDSLLNVPVKEHTHPLLLLLEYSPEGALLEQRQVFQTELLEFLMEIISLPSQEDGHTTHPSTLDSNSQRPEGQPAILMENMVFFIQKFVEKLYSGLFLVEPEVLLVFLVDQIVVVLENGQSQRENAVSSLYNSTNRALLYFMSRPRRTQVEQEAVIRTLRVVVARWDVVMATYNASVHFITCLLHCLLLIRSGSYPEGFGWETHKKHKRKILSHLFPFKTRRTATLTQVPDADKELMSLVESVWCRTLAERRALLEDTYKIELSANQAQRTGPVSMSDLSPLWQETSVKVWQLYTDNVKRKLSSNTQRKPGVISSALRSVHKRLGKERGTVEEFLSCMATHMTRGQEMFENLMKNHIQLRACEWECLETLWLQVEEELLRERGVFGPGPGVVLPQGWVQDAAEGPNRTRPRIRRRAQRRSKRLTDMCLRNALSEGTRGRTDTNSEPRILCDLGTEATEEEVEEEEGEDSDRLTFFPVLTETTTTAPTKPCPAEPTTPDSCSRTHTCSLIHTLLQELQPAEEIKVKACVLVVSGLSVTEGVLLFGSESLYVCEGFTLTPTGDVCCRKHHPTSVRDSYISSMLTTDITSSRRWPYQDIREVHFMRFLLEDNALEIFMQNGYSVFLVFFNKDHVSAFKRLCSLAPALKGRGATEIISNVRRTPVEKAALVKWQRGEISNFEYLMHLNTLSGRTYSDLMQYPVFPWVLADYESETLDLTNPATFRDLSKPMGAQTEKRRQMFIERYNEVDVSEGELTARCHYCTHYSSAIIVSSFLVRMEPFSQTYLTLQGGYDVAERMFHSVKKEWDSASRDNMGDVRELIPEFYYLPDFLVNANHFRLGCMQDGTTLGDVVLPPWAKEDPQEFIRVHREALESDYVSSHLHLWIDLIFGCRQQGPAAVESLNTFHPYFYAKRRGTGRQDPLSDPLIKSTIQGYVNNFGQVPKQLFTKPHPPRTASKKEGSAPAQPTPFFFRLDKLKPSVQPLKEVLGGSVGQVVCAEKEVLVVEKNRLLIPPLWNIYFSWGFPDNSCSFGHYTTEKTFAVCESVCDWGQMLCAACPNQATIVTAGTSSVVCVWDVSISKDKLNHMKLRQVLYGHTDAVTCLAVSEVHGVIVSGSCDLTCILWDLEDLTYVTQLPGHRASITALAINDLTGEIATCAGPSLYLWTMTGQLLTWLDTSCGADVTSGHSERDILSICFTQRNEWDSRNVLVSGSADGIVRIWRTEHNRTSADPLQEPRSPGLPETPVVEDGSGRGQSWERHLVLCCELNRSQSVSRRRYKNNPAVTALAMSRTHATLLVGDAWGRVFTWTCE